jgi:shikimate kinase
VPDNIFLCGLSGSGKSTIAPLLAQRRGCDFVDTDALIVADAGMPISDIFAREGESGFREREARAVAAACKKSGAVVALGGGALERDDSFERVLRAGTLVFLDARDDVLLARLTQSAHEVRPMLANPGALARLRERRLARFSQAKISIDTSGLSPEEIASRVMVSVASAASEVEPRSSG